MGGEAVYTHVTLQTPYTYRTIRAACDEGVAAHLELADEAGVALKHGETVSRRPVSIRLRVRGMDGWMDGLPRFRIPYSHRSVQRTRRDPDPVKGNRIDLAEVTGQRPETSSLGYTPDTRGGIVTPTHHDIAVNLETPDTGLMAHEDILTHSLLNVPYTQSRVPGSGDGRLTVTHLEASHR